MSDEVVKFVRRRNFRFVRELGRGGCGKTVLLFDDIIGKNFVCKKYEPSDSGRREELFESFMNEIHFMHRVFHPNVVRVFNYHVVPEQQLGYIVMEYVEGETIDKHIEASPEDLVSVFSQTIAAFCHLEDCGILHRDLRYQNILVSTEGVVKVIDLGFGKEVRGLEDFDKSITLNWAFTPPIEFGDGKYDFQSEIYFVGKLFEQIMTSNSVDDERVAPVVRKMCAERPSKRFANFSEVQLALAQAELVGPELSDELVAVYRAFADALMSCISKIEARSTYVTDAAKIIPKLERAYEASMLEYSVGGSRIVGCFVNGSYRYLRDCEFEVGKLKAFLKTFKASTAETKRIILANLFGRLDAIERYSTKIDDEIPF